MPIAKTPTKNLTHADDAPRTAAVPREEPRNVTDDAQRDLLDSAASDPYDNVACTD
jgi:hypothetical protein